MVNKLFKYEYIILGMNIKKARFLRDFSKCDLGELIAKDDSYVTAVENGDMELTLSEILNIAKKLNVESAALLDFRDVKMHF